MNWKRNATAVLGRVLDMLVTSIFAGMVLLFVTALAVLVGTSWPLLSSFFAENPSAATVATYNTFAMPLAMLMAFLVSISAVVRPGGMALEGWKGKLDGQEISVKPMERLVKEFELSADSGATSEPAQIKLNLIDESGKADTFALAWIARKA